jgi:hypothetical protein
VIDEIVRADDSHAPRSGTTASLTALKSSTNAVQ